MGVDKGKIFENKIRDGLKASSNISYERLKDPMAGQLGIANTCDFIAYLYPHQFYLECKSCMGSYFYLKRLTETQWNGLIEHSKVNGVKAGVLLWFVEDDINIYISIQTLLKWRNEGHKGVSVTNIKNSELEYTPLTATKLKVYYRYDMERSLINIAKVQ